jgi:quinol monooxygenase YgiN
MATEVRLYTINRGMLDSWLKAFKEKIMPTSAQFGIRIHAAWVNRPQNEFIWIRSYDSAELLDAYYKSPERAAYGEHVGSHIAKIEVREVECVVGEVPVANT